MKIQLRQYEKYPFLGGGQYRPEKGVHFTPESGGQFQPVPLVTLGIYYYPFDFNNSGNSGHNFYWKLLVK
ncbi:MAG: hypothetical protein KAQ79_18350 [Cyclobacteriaceae bacterium]|nr:hypothetical protein [Cyclobacteriaceae bacterium]